jgi:excisionase family DNA binding protein
MKFDNEIISVMEAAKICKVTRATIWRWIKSGLLNAGMTAGGHYRITREDLHNLIKSKGMTSSCRTSIGKHKILIVDDDPSVRKMLGQVLTRNEYDVIYASDGFEAGVKTIKFEPHIVILDLFMPKMDGFEVCQQLKKNSDTSAIKIIAISGYKTEENKERILSCGADRFFAKPLSIEVLISEISHLIRTE